MSTIIVPFRMDQHLMTLPASACGHITHFQWCEDVLCIDKKKRVSPSPYSALYVNTRDFLFEARMYMYTETRWIHSHKEEQEFNG